MNTPIDTQARFAVRAALAVCVLAIPQACLGGFVQYTSFDTWSAAAPISTTLTFADFPTGTKIDTEYAALGVVFNDTDGNYIDFNPGNYDDDYGLDGEHVISVLLSTPMFGVGVDFPGSTLIKLYAGDTLLYTSLFFGGIGPGFFAGITSTVPFDHVVFTRDAPQTQVFLDNLYFSSTPVPSPATALALIPVLGVRRRGRCATR